MYKAQRIILMLAIALTGMVAAVSEDLPKTAATNFNNPTEEILITPQSMVQDKGVLVKDPAARSGWALLSDPAHTAGQGYLTFWYSYKQGPGKVRITYRLKVADNTDTKPVALVMVCIWGNDLKDTEKTNNIGVPIRGTDFHAPNTYQDFSYEIDKGEAGFGGWGVQTTGVTQLWCDGITVTQLSHFTTQELLERVNAPVKPADLTFAPKTLRIHETHGLFMEQWHVADAVKGILAATHPGATWTRSTVSIDPQRTSLNGYPSKWNELYDCSAIVLDNVPAKAVTIVGCLMLKQYLEDGGTVLLLGDTHSLAAGQWAESAIGPFLPVTFTAPANTTYAQHPLPLQPAEKLLADLDWTAQPYTVYYHAATLRPGAQLLCASGTTPLIAESKVGKGRLLVCLLSVQGEPDAKAPGVPFWQWTEWPKLMARLLSESF